MNKDGTVYNMGNSVGSKGPAYNVIEFPAGTSNRAFNKYNKYFFIFVFFIKGMEHFVDQKLLLPFRHVGR